MARLRSAELLAVLVAFAQAGLAAERQPDEVAFDARTGGLTAGWVDQGWTRPTPGADGRAELDLAEQRTWSVARPGLKGRFEAVTLRLRGGAAGLPLLEVRVDSLRAELFPRVRIEPRHVHPFVDGVSELRIPIAELSPLGRPFDRIVIRTAKSLARAVVFVDYLALVPVPGEPLGPAPGQAQPPPPAKKSRLAVRPAAPAKTSPAKAAKPPKSRPARALASPSAQPGAATPPAHREVSMLVDCQAGRHPVSAMIYGIAYRPDRDLPDGDQWTLGASARRWGGNPSSRYNWELGNAWNTASDWFFRNVNCTGWPRFSAELFLEQQEQEGLLTALTLPTLGWVAKDTTSYSFPVARFGPQQRTAPEEPDAGNGISLAGKPLPPLPPTQTSVPAPPEFIQRWVESIRRGSPGRQRVQLYILDNEPALWHETHRDVHPNPVTYEELLDRTIRYGEAVRRADPEATIAGPAEWGWSGYLYSALDAKVSFTLRPDRLAHGDVPLVPWLLRNVRAREAETRSRILDVLDLHFYPQAKGLGVGTNGDTDAPTSALRIRSTRALWDPTYRDESWIGEPVRLIPRMKEWVRDNAPGLGLSIGEWSFGAEQHMSGGLAVAEALGRFGALGLTAAFYWTFPPRDSPAANAFRAYRDFDGKGARFLDQSVPARSNEPSLSSIFASQDPGGQTLVAVLLNFDPERPVDAVVTLNGCGKVQGGRRFAYDGSAPRLAPAGPVALPGPGGLRVPLGAWSITVLDLKLER